MIVSKTSASAFQENKAVNTCEVLDDLSGVGVLDDCSWRYRDLHVVSGTAVAACPAAVLPVLRTEGPDDLQMSQCPEVVLDHKDKIAALAAVTAVGAALLDEFLTSERDTTIAPVSGGNVDIGFI